MEIKVRHLIHRTRNPFYRASRRNFSRARGDCPRFSKLGGEGVFIAFLPLSQNFRHAQIFQGGGGGKWSFVEIRGPAWENILLSDTLVTKMSSHFQIILVTFSCVADYIADYIADYVADGQIDMPKMCSLRFSGVTVSAFGILPGALIMFDLCSIHLLR